MLDGKTENELWLERINQIPENEFELIGSGGYGKYTKLKLKQNHQNHVAVKIVQGVGKLSDYETQVRALEKEYAIVDKSGQPPANYSIFCNCSEMSPEVQIMI